MGDSPAGKWPQPPPDPRVVHRQGAAALDPPEGQAGSRVAIQTCIPVLTDLWAPTGPTLNPSDGQAGDHVAIETCIRDVTKLWDDPASTDRQTARPSAGDPRAGDQLEEQLQKAARRAADDWLAEWDTPDGGGSVWQVFKRISAEILSGDASAGDASAGDGIDVCGVPEQMFSDPVGRCSNGAAEDDSDLDAARMPPPKRRR